MEGVVLLDTGVLFDFLADEEGASETEKILAEGKGGVSSITVYELFRGVESKKHLEERRTLLSFLHVLDVTSRVARMAGRLYTRLKKKGKLVANEDILIGATCVEYNMPLLTGNKRHFEPMPGVRFYEEEG